MQNNAFKICAHNCTSTIRLGVRRIQRIDDYIQTHPYTTLALSSLAGDGCYIGFAFYSGHGLSVPQLAGAVLALAGQVVALAYGDKDMKHLDSETGLLTKTIWNMRIFAQRATDFATDKTPVTNHTALAFNLLACNGVGMVADAMPHILDGSSIEKFILGGSIIAGCARFAEAESLPQGHRQNKLFDKGRNSFNAALAANAGLTISSFNLFTGMALVSFGVASYARHFIGKPAPR